MYFKDLKRWMYIGVTIMMTFRVIKMFNFSSLKAVANRKLDLVNAQVKVKNSQSVYFSNNREKMNS